MSTTEAPTMIRLRHPELKGLIYGPDRDEAIVFGNRAGLADGEAWIPENHPLLDGLLRDHPEIEIVNAGGPTILYACPWHPNSVFKTKNALLTHMRAKSHEAGDLPVEGPSGAPQAIPDVTAANGQEIRPDPSRPAPIETPPPPPLDQRNVGK